jgi:hypothetical protein
MVGAWGGYESRPNRVQVDVAAKLFQVRIRIDQKGFESSLKQMSITPMLLVEKGRIANVQPLDRRT